MIEKLCTYNNIIFILIHTWSRNQLNQQNPFSVSRPLAWPWHSGRNISNTSWWTFMIWLQMSAANATSTRCLTPSCFWSVSKHLRIIWSFVASANNYCRYLETHVHVLLQNMMEWRGLITSLLMSWYYRAPSPFVNWVCWLRLHRVGKPVVLEVWLAKPCFT